MRRYFFYLAVALLAFVFGSLVVVKFYRLRNEKYVATLHVTQVRPLVLSFPKKEFTKQFEVSDDIHSKEKSICRNKTLRLVWRQLKKEVTEFFGDVADGDCTRFFTVEKIVDLNGDGENEIFIQSFGAPLCGATGNCQLYVFSQKGNSYKLILFADMTQRFNIRKTKSNDYFNIETLSHGSSISGGLDVYKFNGKEYKVKNCFNYAYSIDNPGDRILTKRKCWENGERNY